MHLHFHFTPSLLFPFPNALWIQAAEGTFGKLVIKGKRLKVMWGKAQGSAPTPGHSSDAKLTPVPGLPPAREFSDCMIVWCVWCVWCGVWRGVVCGVVWCGVWCGVVCGVVCVYGICWFTGNVQRIGG